MRQRIRSGDGVSGWDGCASKGQRSIGRLAPCEAPGSTSVVVTYRTGATVDAALAPLLADNRFRILVVDNASGDETLERLVGLPIETIALEQNGGFAHGCNVGAAAGDSPYILFLNPDASIEAAAVQMLVDAMDAESKVGAAAPRIREPDGALDYSLRRFPRLRSTYAQAFFLHRLFPDAAWVDEVIRDSSVYEHAGTGGVGLRRLFPCPQDGSRADRRARRELLPLQRGHGRLRADLGSGV